MHSEADKPDKNLRPWASVGLLLEAAAPEKSQLRRGVGWLLAAASLEALGPIMSKYFIDMFLLPRHFDLPAMGLLLTLLLALLRHLLLLLWSNL